MVAPHERKRWQIQLSPQIHRPTVAIRNLRADDVALVMDFSIPYQEIFRLNYLVHGKSYSRVAFHNAFLRTRQIAEGL